MLPLDFIDSMYTRLGTELDAFCQSLALPPTVSIRLNDKVPAGRIDILQADAAQQRVPWSSTGYYLSSRPQFTLDPLLHAGCYYVQEASSMFLEHVLRQFVSRDAVALDLCAAPGGKSTILSQYLQDGLLVSNEVVRQRVFVLSENMQKWGNGNTVVTYNKVSDFARKLPNLFDCMLVDAPCSGEGMFRKDEQAQQQWTLKLVEQCAERQRDILREAWGALKPGGILIYSTCTFNEEENEKVVRYVVDELGATVLPVDIDPKWGITQGLGCHFYPHKTRGEGLYMCVLRKRETPYSTLKIRLPKQKRSAQPETEVCLRWLQNPDKWHLHQTERFSIAYPAKFEELIEYMYSCLTCVSVGFGLSELRGRHQAPQHSLSMAKDVNTREFAVADVDKEKALSYLRSEAIVLDGVPLGYVLLTYHNVPLGFVKSVDGRCNNLYPNEWRIRTL